MRLRVTVGVVMVVALVCAACSSEAPTGHVTRSPADLTTGFAEIKVPLPTRQSAMVVAAGDHVVVFGGQRSEAGRLIPRNDGADYDVKKGEWTQMPNAPFDRALYYAAGVWTGAEVVVVGMPCEVQENLDTIYDAQCKHPEIAAAAYTSATHSWRSLDGRPDRYLLIPFGEGWTGRAALFGTDTGDPGREQLIYDTERKSWRFVPAFPGTDTICAVSGAIVAIQTGQVLADRTQHHPNPEAVASPLLVSHLDLGSDTWNAMSPTPKPASTGADSEPVVCAAGQAAYFPVFLGSGINAGGLWYEPQDGRWLELPPLGTAGSYEIGSIASIHGTKVVSVGNPHRGPGESLLVLPPGAQSWSRRPSPMTSFAPFQALDGLVLVVPADEDGSGVRTIGLLDPVRYVNGSDGTSK